MHDQFTLLLVLKTPKIRGRRMIIKDDFIKNDDGSVTLHFGPKAPKGKENNWIQTVPDKSWFAILRLYGPLEPWFDKTWQPGEIELI